MNSGVIAVEIFSKSIEAAQDRGQSLSSSTSGGGVVVGTFVELSCRNLGSCFLCVLIVPV